MTVPSELMPLATLPSGGVAGPKGVQRIGEREMGEPESEWTEAGREILF